MAALFWACVTPERRFKTLRLMNALARGIPGARVMLGGPPASPAPFAVCGKEWLALYDRVAWTQHVSKVTYRTVFEFLRSAGFYYEQPRRVAR